MTAVREVAPAKVNLYLHVGPLRTDGLHDLASLFVFAEDGDEVIAAPADDLSLSIEGPFADALAPFSVSDNLVLRAGEALQAATGASHGAALTLKKNLPVAAGIGGGSADAAAALRALIKLWGVSISEAELRALAFSLGADIPACLEKRPVLVDGAGENLSPAAPLPPLSILLVNPGVDMPTGPVFKRYDTDFPAPPAPEHALMREPSIDAVRAVMASSRNDLEAPARALAPQIGELLDEMSAQSGVISARMSGSGATCFALFEDESAAEAARRLFAAKGHWAMASRLATG